MRPVVRSWSPRLLVPYHLRIHPWCPLPLLFLYRTSLFFIALYNFFEKSLETGSQSTFLLFWLRNVKLVLSHHLLLVWHRHFLCENFWLIELYELALVFHHGHSRVSSSAWKFCVFVYNLVVLSHLFVMGFCVVMKPIFHPNFDLLWSWDALGDLSHVVEIPWNIGVTWSSHLVSLWWPNIFHVLLNDQISII